MSRSAGALLVDKISQLPDALLESILSHMTLREAARTSVLSSRWYKVWTFIPDLNFDASVTLRFLEVQRVLEVQRIQELLMIERHKYVNWVNSVLESYQGLTLDKFSVGFDLNGDFGHDIDRWVNFALEKKVRRLVIDFRNYAGYPQYEHYRFPFTVFRLPSGTLHTHNVGFSKCSSLRVLLLRQVAITGDVVEYFLSNCPFLEQLCVEGSDLIVDLKVPEPLHCLKYLEVKYCFNVKSIDISATNLFSFKYFGPRFIMSYEKLPNLVELDIKGPYSDYIVDNPSLLSNYAFRLQTLRLRVMHVKESMGLLRFPVLTRLKTLELAVEAKDGDSLLLFAPLIKASPSLCRFTMKLSLQLRNPCGRRIQQKLPRCPHQCLKVVEIIGFQGCTIDNEFAAYLVENAVMLEKIIIDPRQPLLLGTPWEYDHMEKIRTARKRAKQFKTNLSLGSKLLLL
ncbi:F-box/LRR-repeat protein At3g58900-like isoform X2 [Tripterygium wilfordii]|nr:F-box/LRR-repeat protein At3g58900-like isoform X2 [Tripterygium wilfordii]XP_038696481.1 F-box/LRR-repeat protein At3g58900-like isoform X2 [Tripterygium wilfordii]XP_038696482.1 F-box/LRR-repeat protein At3g58900-like isoform X2 [Tripterygium wilfordii]